jgi:hypothetical protein
VPGTVSCQLGLAGVDLGEQVAVPVEDRQHITFTGEQGPATGTPLSVQYSGDSEHYVARVIASGERAVAAGRDISGTVTTGDQAVPGDHHPAS